MPKGKAYGGERFQVQVLIGTIYYIRTKVISCKKKLQILTTNSGSYLASEGFGLGIAFFSPIQVLVGTKCQSCKTGLDSGIVLNLA